MATKKTYQAPSKRSVVPLEVIEPPKSAVQDFRNRLDAGDWQGMLALLKKYPLLINTPADDGMTPLQAVISDGNIDILEPMLKRSDIDIGDALLHAVEKRDPKIIDQVMEAMDNRSLPTDGPFENSSHFKFYTTPLSLACQQENFDLIGILLKRGHTLHLPHGHGCGCDSCRLDHPFGEKLEKRLHRIDAYTAACSTAFVFHHDDPIDYAMSLCRYLDECKTHDISFHANYNEMIEKLQDACVKLISETDTKEFIDIVLSQRRENQVSNECIFGYPRVKAALEADQKLFVSQPGCLSVIHEAFCGTWHDEFSARMSKRIFRGLFHTILYPFTALLFVLSFGRFPDSYKNPKARLVTSISSYVTFYVAVWFYTQFEGEEKTFMSTSDIKHGVLVYIFFYVIGMWAIVLTDLRRLGFIRLFSAWWRAYDLIFLVVWSCAFIASIDSIMQTSAHGFRELHLAHWRPAEAQFMFKIFISWAAVMSTVRFFYYGQLLKRFGAVTISIGRCMPTVMRYMVFLGMVLALFGIGLNHLYEHYKYSEIIRNGVKVVNPVQLTSVFSAIRILYWAIYGYMLPESWDIVVGQVGHGSGKLEEKHHSIVSFSGEWMGVTYYIVKVLILMKLMISVMTVTAIAVVESALQDWNFVRVEIWSEYFQDSRIIPPPFNLLQIFVHGLIYLVRKVRKQKRPLSAWDMNYHPPQEEEIKRVQYKEVISNLKKRAQLKQRKPEQEPENTEGETKLIDLIRTSI